VDCGPTGFCANSFELKYEAGTDPRTGKCVTKYLNVKVATKRETQVRLAELITAFAKGSRVDVIKITVAELDNIGANFSRQAL